MKAHPAAGEDSRAPSHSSPPPKKNDGAGRAFEQSPSGVPDHLQPYVVEQDTARYTAIDQAVWRFVLLQLGARLGQTAHPSYARGLEQSGISPDTIPSVAQMNDCLSRIGWRAVCVDGFIPPRAFQAFQALRILPIAAEIRTPDHLPYTPAPDIIHEAAGHAPILVDEVYSSYVQRIGEVASRAFSSPRDARVDAAVRRLSDLEDQPRPDGEAVEEARQELGAAVTDLGEPSEAARVARLFWWTAEYGLVGTPRDYRLYGAGLLSSLGESHFCHRPAVEKRVLGSECTEVGYDITRPQPQLYVARDFEHLHEVLAAVESTLACSVGGMRALRAALESRELCTLGLDAGTEVVGTLEALEGSCRHGFVELSPGACFTRTGQVIARHGERLLVPFGPLSDGRDPRGIERLELTRQLESAGGLRLSSGLEIRGRARAGGDAAMLMLESVEIRRGPGVVLTSSGPYPLALAGEALGARAGSTVPECWPKGAGASERRRAPAERQLSPERAALNEAYRQSLDAPRIERLDAGPTGLGALERLHDEARRRSPHEWLLYWNLLERFAPGARHAPLARKLQSHLIRLEHHYGGRHPITMGLDYLTLRV